MAKDNELSKLRAEAKRLQSNTGKKLSRIRAKGITSVGSTLDIRKPPELLGRYTKKQLVSHMDRLKNFNSRKTQFVPGVRGTPIPQASWRKYKQAEKAYNARIEAVREAVGDIRLGDPNKGGMSTMTIGERFDKMIPRKGPSMGGGSMRYWPMNRSSRGIPDESKIQKLIDDMNKKSEPGYQSQQEKRIRDNFDALLEQTNRKDIRELAKDLTNEEFAILWNFSPVISTLVENYYSVLEMMDEKDSAMEFTGIDESFDEVRDIMRWAVDTGSLRGRLVEFETGEIEKVTRKSKK